ncbi:hypothetical protein ACIQXM_09280 [Arthrobacter sp. NPDC097144]|uniref:hypothetical protein n=1 Tax=Arthrobacter sp. NPDC097144 TaxID=3363946 RepID=UPI00380365CB
MADSPAHDDLVLPDYDHIPLGTLPSRLSPLDEAGVSGLLAYEQAHGNRLPVVQVLENRLEALRSGTEPSGSLPDELPEVTRSQQGSKVSPATTGPKINPPSQGDPTNPAQPRQ